MYIYSFDLSLSNTGICIFNEEGNPVYINSIPTSSKLETKDRLKIIADRLIELRGEYPSKKIVMESAFTRFNKATQQLYRVHGIVNYLFADCEQIYLGSTEVKKVLTGKGRAEKRDVQKIVSSLFPNLVFKNEDESDAVAIGVCYLKKGL